jgi:drug/metabolite transporter (DMT)-like permease
MEIPDDFTTERVLEDVRAIVAVVPVECDGLLAAAAAVPELSLAAVTLLNFESNRLMGPNTAGAIGGLAPLFAQLLAVMLLGEHLRFEQLSGIAAIVAGVALM